MNDEERARFWKVLCELHDAGSNSVEKLLAVRPLPPYICRFRTMGESSLDQLQSNTLLFSAASYYDDPFDTYFYIDSRRLATALSQISDAYESGSIRVVLDSIGCPDDLISILMDHLKGPVPSFNSVGQMLENAHDWVLGNMNTICFSEDPLNEALWLKYAANHRGFVQVYDTNALLQLSMSKELSLWPPSEQQPGLFPVCYSDERYDATRFALGMFLLRDFPSELYRTNPSLWGLISNSLCWEAERISLTKKGCHRYDREWRMIYPQLTSERPEISLKPAYVAVGLKMHGYERRLISSAAEIAGISDVREVYIDETDKLAMRPLIIDS